MKKLLLAFIFIFVFLFSANATHAGSTKIGIGAKLSNGNVNLSFSNLSKVKNITYELTYTRSGAQEGVRGSVLFKGKGPITKKILLGTCSGKVCTLHRNVKNIKVKIITKYTNGKSESKSYNVK